MLANAGDEVPPGVAEDRIAIMRDHARSGRGVRPVPNDPLDGSWGTEIGVEPEVSHGYLAV